MKKTLKQIACSLLLLIFTFVCALPAGATKWWDSDLNAANNDTLTGAGLGGSAGTWQNLGSANFYNLVTDVAWDNTAFAAEEVVLMGTAGTVTLSATAKTCGSLTFKVTGYTIAPTSTASTLTLSAGGARNVTVETGTATISCILLGTGGFTKQGPGVLILSNSGNNQTGAIFINEGTLELTLANRIGSQAVSSGDITINGGTLRNDDLGAASNFLTPNRGIIVGASGATLFLPSSGQILVYSGPISGSGNTLTLTGSSGELRATTNATVLAGGHNTFGKLVVDTAMFTIGHAATGGAEDSLGEVPAVTTDDAITLKNGGRMRLNVASITLDSKRGITLGTGGGTIRAVAGATLTIPSAIKGSNPLTIGTTDAGTVVLASTDNSFGNLTVASGTLLVNGSIGSGTVTVNSGGKLGGNGTINGPITVNSGASVGAGAGAGILTNAAGLNLSAGGTNVWELAANSTVTPGADFDQIELTGGNLVLGGNSKLQIKFIGGATFPDISNPFWQVSHSWPILVGSGSAANPGSSNFTFIDGTNGCTAGVFSTTADANGNVQLNFTPTVVPVLPVIVSVISDGTNLIFSGTNGVAGNSYVVLSSTDVTLPLASWTPEATNTFEVGGAFSVTNAISPGTPQKFLTVRLP